MDRGKQPLFIWLLEYGEKTHNRRVSCNEVLNQAVEEKLCCSQTDSSAQVLRSLFFECFDVPPHTKEKAHQSGYSLAGDYDHVSANLKSEYYFRLLEFRELQLARETAEQANRSSIIAQEQSSQSIRIAIYAVLASVLVAIFTTAWQLNSSIQIDPQQLSRLETALSNSLGTESLSRSAPDLEEIPVGEPINSSAVSSTSVITGAD